MSKKHDDDVQDHHLMMSNKYSKSEIQCKENYGNFHDEKNL